MHINIRSHKNIVFFSTKTEPEFNRPSKKPRNKESCVLLIRYILIYSNYDLWLYECLQGCGACRIIKAVWIIIAQIIQ